MLVPRERLTHSPGPLAPYGPIAANVDKAFAGVGVGLGFLVFSKFANSKMDNILVSGTRVTLRNPNIFCLV